MRERQRNRKVKPMGRLCNDMGGIGIGIGIIGKDFEYEKHIFTFT
jgi:hypothetical protein